MIVKQSKRFQRNPAVPYAYFTIQELNIAIETTLPNNYNFEIEKTLWRIDTENAKNIGLQFPEGLLAYSLQIASILKRFSQKEVDITIFGDVTYGACCIDDFTSKALNIDLLIHYGHSCLVPIQNTSLSCLYVFVDIKIEISHLISTILKHFPPNKNRVLILLGTVQFSSAIYATKQKLETYYDTDNICLPQELPLTPGEVLGCTSPKINLNPLKTYIGIFIADGRFHLESAMIHNPNISFFRYDPFTKILTSERYEYDLQNQRRESAIKKARSSKNIALILSTLGRQGSPVIYDKIQTLPGLKSRVLTLILMSEIYQKKLVLLKKHINTYIQVGCPRLSIDWGYEFFPNSVILSPYEANVAFGQQDYLSVYPMDYYSYKGGVWSNYSNGYFNNSGVEENSSGLEIEIRKRLIREKAQKRKSKLLL